MPLLLGLAGSALLAQPFPAPAIPAWDDQARVIQPGSIHPRLARLTPLGPAAADLAMERMILVLKLSPDAKSRLDLLLRDQQDPTSPRFHQWLTPEQFGAQFGPAKAQLDAATRWLTSQGFTVHGAAKGGLAISFSGTAAQVGKAFRTAIVEYDLDGVRHHGNATAISLPGELAAFASGVASLNDMRRVPLYRQASPAARPLMLGTDGSDWVAPADFATIYGLNTLFSAGTTGAGVTIGVVGETNVNPADHTQFVSIFNLSKYGGTINTVTNGPDPGILTDGEEGEADVDTQWSTAAAPGATIEFVVSASTLTTQGIDLSAQYLVDQNVASVITLSYGGCESELGSAENEYYNQLWAQAAGQGISVFVAAGDNGFADCLAAGATTATASDKGVNGLASTPYNTAVGGTMFNEALHPATSYWVAGAAQSYIPELPWDESATFGAPAAGGGGVSILYPMPAWQLAYMSGGTIAGGVLTSGFRELPDVSLNAGAAHDPTVVIQEGQYEEYGGTSVPTPGMAGIMALVVQKSGRQGNPGFTLYGLAKSQYAAEFASLPYTAIFNDVTTGNTNVPGLAGATAGPGYSLATGLGSLNAANLVANWVPLPSPNPVTAALTAPATSPTIASGGSVTFSGTVGDTAAGPLNYLWSFGDGSSTVTNQSPVTHTYRINGTQNQTFVATLAAFDGTYTKSSSVNVTVTPAGVSTAIALPITSTWVLPAIPITFTAGPTTSQNTTQPVTTFSWNFGDGTTATTGASVTHTFQDNPNTSYTVTLTATDATLATGQASLSLGADLNTVMDVNGDGSIDVRDLLTIAGAWGVQGTASNFNGLNFFADLNGDGMVDDTDLSLWMQYFVPGVIQ